MGNRQNSHAFLIELIDGFEDFLLDLVGERDDLAVVLGVG
ncbi:hypothetical protein SDC9_47629 [bioreactor metagenome]|uniref:Uncharacterized protein n=1 Tax=bioreactor metagenome TaxID=1076179 RepID=A0A644WCS6_9ZZZZ